jgi:circadian clock protein KaiB
LDWTCGQYLLLKLMASEQVPHGIPAEQADYVLHLYISGATPNSLRAVRHLTDICERYLAGRFDLRIIDLYQQPEAAKAAHIIAAPTLVGHWAGQTRRLVGDLSDRVRLLQLLGIEPAANDPYLHV